MLQVQENSNWKLNREFLTAYAMPFIIMNDTVSYNLHPQSLKDQCLLHLKSALLHSVETFTQMQTDDTTFQYIVHFVTDWKKREIPACTKRVLITSNWFEHIDRFIDLLKSISVYLFIFFKLCIAIVTRSKVLYRCQEEDPPSCIDELTWWAICVLSFSWWLPNSQHLLTISTRPLQNTAFFVQKLSHFYIYFTTY